MFNTSVDKILAVFDKTIAKLEKHIENQDIQIRVCETAKQAADLLLIEVQAEKTKAAKALVKIRALIS